MTTAKKTQFFCNCFRVQSLFHVWFQVEASSIQMANWAVT